MMRLPNFKMNYAVSGDSVLSLNKDIREARTCFENTAYKATMVPCGSILEHALLDRLSIDETQARAKSGGLAEKAGVLAVTRLLFFVAFG
jgi:hypothetical protein